MKSQRPTYEYSNVSDRPTGLVLRLGSVLIPGIRKVQAHIEPYATQWAASNRAALGAKGPLWVVLGDSMAQGIGASSYRKGWVGQLDDLLKQDGKKYRLLNLSVSGARVADVLERQLPALQALGQKPVLVTIMIGSNDRSRKRYRRQLVTRYGTLLQELPVGSVVGSPFGNSGIGLKLNNLIQTEAKARGLRIVPNKLGGSFSAWKGKLAADHFHPNDAGYADLAAAFYKAIIS